MWLPRGLAPLGERNFALYWSGQLLSQVGTWIELTATSWLLYSITESPVLLGLVGLFRAVPIVLLSPIGGTIADRVPRRRLLFATQSASVVLSLILGTLVLTGTVQVWHIYLVSFCSSVVGAFDAPARSSMFPTLVPRGQLQNAVALNAMLFRSSMLAGPAAGGLLIAQFGTAVPYYVNALSYFALIAGLLAMRLPPNEAARARPSVGADALSGIRYVLRSPILPLILGVEACLNIFGSNSALVTIFARDVLGMGAQGFGLLLSGQGAGAILGTVVLVLVGDLRRKGLVMIGAGSVYAVAMVSFAWSRSFQLSVACLVVLGCVDAVWGAMRNTIVQLAADDEYRGRVMGLTVVTTRGVTNLAQVQTGAAVALLGPVAAATLGAALVALTVLGGAARSERLRTFAGGAPRHAVRSPV
ncbi:MAG: MFS transporter [Candidatus Limnocylindria bacterium]|nr:MFS transporter [Candidatus Limnocylindria bacterium]